MVTVLLVWCALSGSGHDCRCLRGASRRGLRSCPGRGSRNGAARYAYLHSKSPRARRISRFSTNRFSVPAEVSAVNRWMRRQFRLTLQVSRHRIQTSKAGHCGHALWGRIYWLVTVQRIVNAIRVGVKAGITAIDTEVVKAYNYDLFPPADGRVSTVLLGLDS
jgi:hypothetical protein